MSADATGAGAPVAHAAPAASAVPRDEALLTAALRLAPRRFRLPPLPADPGSARAAGAETALAFAIEAARVAHRRHAELPPALAGLFTEALAPLIRRALRTEAGDLAFQALVLRSQVPEIEEQLRLDAQAAADRRAVRAAVDALAHPGKLRRLAPGARREALQALHRLAAAGDWAGLRRAAGPSPAPALREDEALPAALRALHDSPALARLERGAALQDLDSVRRYRALCAQGGPAAGSDAAAASGRAAARLGAQAEAAVVHAFGQVAAVLNARGGEAARCRVVQGLRTPGGFPGAVGGAKEEWDVALVRGAGAAGAVDVLLLAEVKASPAAASSDLSRLLRGLRRLAQADNGAVYGFASGDGEVAVRGCSLRRLQPPGAGLPPQVIYACAAAAEARTPVLGAAAKAQLLAEPASLGFTAALSGGGAPEPARLAPVWDALAHALRLRAVLNQAEVARCVREAMVHPDDLLAGLAAALAAGS